MSLLQLNSKTLDVSPLHNMPHSEYEDLIPVEGHQNLYRDRNTGSIVNTNKDGYDNYIKLKRLKQNEKQELDTLKSDIEEIKSLLKELTNGPRRY